MSRRHLMPVIAAAIAGLAATASPAAAQGPSACQSSALAPSTDTVPQVEQTIVCLLNAERTRRGLPRLRENDRLETAADKHSRDMVRRDYFDHRSPGGSSPSDRIKDAGYLRGARGWTVGENLAWGTGSLATPRKIVAGWMNSTGHRHNILNRSYREIGVGVALGSPGYGSRGATYTTTFGAHL